MPRQRGQRLNFNFTKGWNTEASPLTFPEGTAQDIDNVILDIDGSIRRRGGVDYDDQNTYFGMDTIPLYNTYAVMVDEWTNVGGNGSNKLLVSQFGTTLYFHEFAGVNTISNLVDSLDFSSYAVDIPEARKGVVQVTSGLGYLFVTGQYIDPFYVAYDSGAGTVSATPIYIEIRDFDGVEDSLDVDERPATLTALHEYNLRNQGWPDSFDCILNGASKTTTDPVDYTFTHKAVYPSNADILYFGKTATGSTEDDIDRYDPSTMFKAVTGTTPAPQGKFVLDAFNRARSVVSGLSVSGADEVFDTRPKAVAFHNGRVFYAGLKDAGHTGEVYYSQQLTNIDNVGYCYQQNDPTAEEFNDLLPTDGGLLIIPDAGEILRLEEANNGILLFATNGVWEISGQEGRFSATEFTIRKVTELGVLSADTVVNADSNWFYWSTTGIVALQRDKVSQYLAADVISKATIQTGYNNITLSNRENARGTFIRNEKKIYWLYGTDEDFDGVNGRFKYNGVLVLDTQLGAFYKYSISDVVADAAPYVAGVVEMAATVDATVAEEVTALGITVTAGGVDVTVSGAGYGDQASIFSPLKLLCVRPGTAGNNALTFAEFRSNTFHDWYYYDGTGADYTSYIETGYDHGGTPMYEKSPTYVYTYLRRASKSDFPLLPGYV